MKRRASALPHVLIAVYITLLNTVRFSAAGLKALHMEHFAASWPQAASLGAALLMGLMVYREHQRDAISPVSKGYLLYFITNVAAYWVLPARLGPGTASANPTGVLYGCLLAITVFPALFARQYFTEYFARRTTPPAVWGTDIFRRINRNMTWMWAGIFAVSGAITLVPGLLSLQRGLLTVLASQLVLPLLFMRFVGVPLNKRYPGYYQRKAGIEPVGSGAQGAGDHFVQAINPKTEKEEVMSNRLRVVAINGSPHTAIGNTSLMLRMIEPVLAKEGIDLEEVFLASTRIEYCVGCGVCMEKGTCWRQDDHAEIVGKMLGADGVILASPVYFRHVTAQMKTFLDRSLAYGHKPRAAVETGYGDKRIGRDGGDGGCGVSGEHAQGVRGFFDRTPHGNSSRPRRFYGDGARRGEGKGHGFGSCKGYQGKAAIPRHRERPFLLSFHEGPRAAGEGVHA